MSFVYLTITLEQRKLTFMETLDAIQRNSSVEEIPRGKDVVIRLNNSDIVILSFIVGLVLSLIAALVYKAFFTETVSQEAVSQEEVLNDIDNAVKFTKEKPADDFDYPYEDIEEVLGERTNVG